MYTFSASYLCAIYLHLKRTCSAAVLKALKSLKRSKTEKKTFSLRLLQSAMRDKKLRLLLQLRGAASDHAGQGKRGQREEKSSIMI